MFTKSFFKDNFQLLHICYRKYRYFRANILGRLCPKYLANSIFKSRFKRNINWNNPQDLNEKIQWMKFYSDTSLWTLCADKFRVREYIKSKGLEDILVPLYGVWDNATQINFDMLPNSFILKTNHGSGDVVRVTDKSEIDRNSIISALNSLLRNKYGYTTAEPHYIDIKPCIIAEELLSNNTSFSSTLVDYKIWCFNGIPHHIWACYDRKKGSVCVETHDLDWNYLPETSVFYDEFQDGGGKVPRPTNLNKMIDIARILSRDFPIVRVDLYEVNGSVYFGEMTFTSQGGYMEFYTQQFLHEMGKLITLPIRK